jgi:hypothetical protein
MIYVYDILLMVLIIICMYFSYLYGWYDCKISVINRYMDILKQNKE